MKIDAKYIFGLLGLCLGTHACVPIFTSHIHTCVLTLCLPILCVCVCVRLFVCVGVSPSDPEQAEPGSEQQAAAAKGSAQQTQHGGDPHGQAHRRAAGAPL